MLFVMLLAACAPSAPPAAAPAKDQQKPAAAAAATTAPAAASKPADAKPADASAPVAASKPSDATGTLVIAQGTDVNTLDGHQTTTQSDWNAIQLIYEPLVRRDNDLKLGAALATSWKNIDDKTWEFKLRPNVKFTNGEAFDASAVKANIDRAIDPALKVKAAPWIAQIDRADVIDPLTVRIITKQPSPVLVENLTTLYIMSPQFFTGKGPEVVALGGPGTGPYILKEYIKDDHLTVERNPDYTDRSFPIKTITFRAIPDAATRVSALLAGEVLVAVNVPPAASARLTGDVAKVTAPSSRGIYIQMDTTKPPFTDKRVRQAMNYAVDKDSLVKNVLDGSGKVLDGQILSPEYFGYNPNLKPYEYNPDKAKQLLAEAGVTTPLTIDFQTPQGRYLLDKELAEAASGQMAKVGIDAKVQILEFGNFMDRLTKDKTLGPIWLLGYSFPTLDADPQLSWYESASAHSRWKNDEFETLLQQGRVEMDPAKRKDIYYRATALMREEAPTIFLHQQYDIYGVSKKLDWTPRVDQSIWPEGATIKP
jgi:peptide/nickel transport system substrate-binding protein